jgi:hypothetical protein
MGPFFWPLRKRSRQRCGRDPELMWVKTAVVAGEYYAVVIQPKEAIMFKWIVELATFLRFIREGGIIANRHRPEELRRYLAV